MDRLDEYVLVEDPKLQNRSLDDAIEYAVRNLVDPPITGSITSEELFSRNLRLEYEPMQVDEKPRYVNGDYVYTATQIVHMYQGDTKIF